MTGDQDITVKIVSMRDSVNKAIENRRADISPQAAKATAEMMMCAALLGTNLTDNETLQINIVGNEGFKHGIAICDHNLNTRCKISNHSFVPLHVTDAGRADVLELFGSQAQVQVLRNHPSYKEPSTGIIQLESGDIAFNMGVYMQGSEQRTAAFITKVNQTSGMSISLACMYVL